MQINWTHPQRFFLSKFHVSYVSDGNSCGRYTWECLIMMKMSIIIHSLLRMCSDELEWQFQVMGTWHKVPLKVPGGSRVEWEVKTWCETCSCGETRCRGYPKVHHRTKHGIQRTPPSWSWLTNEPFQGDSK